MEYKVVNQYANGSVNQYDVGNGKFFEAFVPDNCSAVTPVVTFQHGLDSDYPDWQSYIKKFSEGDCNSIVIRGQWARPDDLLYNSIVNEYNLNTRSNLNVNVSFSGGAEYSLRETAKMIEENPSSIPPVSFVLDGYVPTDKLKQEGVVDTLVNSNAVVLGFSSHYGRNDAYNDLAKEGVNVIMLRDTSSFGNAHFMMNKSYMEGGLYEYSIGAGELPDRYEITVYDPTSDSFVPLDYSQVSTLDGVYKYFGLNSPFTGASQQPKLTNLSSSASKFASEPPLDLKYSNYGGNELSIKPNSVEYVMNYLQNTLSDDLDTQMTALEALNSELEAYAAEDPAVSYSPDPDLSSVQSAFRTAANAISESTRNISDVSDAIINYGFGNWTNKVSTLLNSFLGIKSDEDQGKGTDRGQDKGTSGGQDKGTGRGQDKGTGRGQDKGTDRGQEKGTSGDQDKGTDRGQDKGSSGGQDTGTDKNQDRSSEIDNNILNNNYNDSNNNDNSSYYDRKPITDNSGNYADLISRDTDSKTLYELSSTGLEFDNSYHNEANNVEFNSNLPSNSLYAAPVAPSPETSEKLVVPNVSDPNSSDKTLYNSVPLLSRKLYTDDLSNSTNVALSATLAIMAAKGIKDVHNNDDEEKVDE